MRRVRSHVDLRARLEQRSDQGFGRGRRRQGARASKRRRGRGRGDGPRRRHGPERWTSSAPEGFAEGFFSSPGSARRGGVDGSDAASEVRSDAADASPPSSAARARSSAATRQCAGPDHRDRPIAPATRMSDAATASLSSAKDLNRFESASVNPATHAFTRDAGETPDPSPNSNSNRRTAEFGFESSRCPEYPEFESSPPPPPPPPLTTIPASASMKRRGAASTAHKNARARTRVA